MGGWPDSVGTALCGGMPQSQPLRARNACLRAEYTAATPWVMELDEASLAIGRIERALSRMEKALTDRAARPAPAPAVTATALPPADQSALKAEVAAVIGELDRLIAEAERG